MTVRIINADVFDGLAKLPDESVHCVVTSPPYFGLRNYGVDGQIGLEATPDEYIERMVAVFREVRRVLRRDGVCWLNVGDSYNNADKWGGGGANTGKHSKDDGGKVPSWGGVRRKWKGMEGVKPKDLIGVPWALTRLLREIRPRGCAFENSSNLRTRGADRVVAEMEAAGYAVWPLVVGAAHAGASHRRLRSWLVGLRRDLVDSRSDAARIGQLRGRQVGPSKDAGPGHHAVGPDTDEAGLRIEPGRRRRENGEGPAITPSDASDADSKSQHALPVDGEVVGRGRGAIAADTTRNGGGVTVPTPIARDHRSPRVSAETLAKNSRPLNESLGLVGLTDPVLLHTIYGLLMGFPAGWLLPIEEINAASQQNSLEGEQPTVTLSHSQSSRRS